MRKYFGKRRIAPVAIALLALALVSGVAFAYWTMTGSGTGTATAGNVSAMTVNQTTVLAPMYPGDSPQTISGNFNNPNSGPVWVSTVTASIASVAKAVGAPAGTCDATDFTLANATATVNAEIPSGSGKGAWTGPTIHFNDKPATDQDGCKGATLNLAYSIP
ncbi:MAG: TasA family protein [Candidatus Limnocylindrales bacterium]|jgi:hypothetical protein